MKMRFASHALPVLLLYNLNATWPAEDIAESVSAARRLRTVLQAEGHPVTELCLEDSNLAARRHPLFAVHAREDKRIHPIFTTHPSLEMQI